MKNRLFGFWERFRYFSHDSLNKDSLPNPWYYYFNVRILYRARQARKKSIKDHVETLFNWKGKNMPSGTDGLMDGIQVPEDSRSKPDISQYPMDFTERVQSFFPECKFFKFEVFVWFDNVIKLTFFVIGSGDIDDHYLLQLPDSPNSEILIFKIRYPLPRPGTVLSIGEAKLRMFKLPTEDTLEDEDCPKERRMRITASWIQLKNHVNSDTGKLCFNPSREN